MKMMNDCRVDLSRGRKTDHGTRQSHPHPEHHRTVPHTRRVGREVPVSPVEHPEGQSRTPPRAPPLVFERPPPTASWRRGTSIRLGCFQSQPVGSRSGRAQSKSKHSNQFQ